MPEAGERDATEEQRAANRHNPQIIIPTQTHTCYSAVPQYTLDPFAISQTPSAQPGHYIYPVSPNLRE